MLSEVGERVEIDLKDDDRLVGILYRGNSRKVVYLFHGLSGNISSNYIQRSALLCRKLGHSVFLINHRGCGEGAGLAKQPYHSGRAEDLSSAIAFGRSHFKEHRHLAIGFSLSGNALLLLLSGKRGSVKPDAAIAVNAPIDLQSAALILKRGLNRIYDLNFVKEFRKEPDIRKKVSAFATVHDFDELHTAPAGGFLNREDYYRSCSTKTLLSKIHTPTVILTSEDDPFCLVKHYREAELSDSVHLHIEKYGGHLGYISSAKNACGSRRWLDYALMQTIQTLDANATE
jgi:predicted alpha/beta-fold hydrolase